ncbi:MAG: tetratricopeptide repeat protein [Flavobacterium sp.]|uniref:tetratricopeptide repeat protein n=1 Tax=Flavobacterium sp. TaxID=239 RepID=UPI00326445C6
MNKITIIVLIIVTLTSSKSVCQNTSIQQFDDVYKKEILLENNALSERILKFPQDIIRLNEETKIALRKKDFTAAYELGVKIDKMMPNNEDVKNFLGKMSSKLGNSSKALFYFDEALRINPLAKWIYINKSIALSEIGKNSEALQTINILIEKYPNWFIAYNIEGALFSNINQKDKAILAYSKAIELEPNSAQVLTNRGNVYLEKNEIDKAKADFEKALSIQPNYEIANQRINFLTK